MSEYEHVKGLSVVTMGEGKKVGVVEDLITDPESRRVRWLRLGNGSLFGGSSSWVPVEAVHGIGEHAVTIEGQDDVLSNGDASDAIELAKSGRELPGKKVITDTGSYIGEVRDYEFGDDFALTSLTIADGRGVFSNKARQVGIGYLLQIGQDVVIVGEGAQEAMETGAEDGREGVPRPVKPAPGA